MMAGPTTDPTRLQSTSRGTECHVFMLPCCFISHVSSLAANDVLESDDPDCSFWLACYFGLQPGLA